MAEQTRTPQQQSNDTQRKTPDQQQKTGERQAAPAVSPAVEGAPSKTAPAPDAAGKDAAKQSGR
ncbi:transcription initiation factor TFIID subunit TAF12 [Caulobacter sp. BE264]|uniref:hypothetical protein n=1 Tax=Caulobacter sp. BE264 TaxID=2817724 RepID=UPI002857BF54|nr:hypothetical protein [Caulobacter sp. BE264]MDR7230169.1 transcription initiation factor TFIID subunit TAF12 [Caulobacter sp. BE264]